MVCAANRTVVHGGERTAREKCRTTITCGQPHLAESSDPDATALVEQVVSRHQMHPIVAVDVGRAVDVRVVRRHQTGTATMICGLRSVKLLSSEPSVARRNLHHVRRATKGLPRDQHVLALSEEGGDAEGGEVFDVQEARRAGDAVDEDGHQRIPGGNRHTGAEVNEFVDQLVGSRNKVCPLSMARNCTTGRSAGESWVLPPEPSEIPRNWDPVSTRLLPRPRGEGGVAICGCQDALKPKPTS